MLTGTISDFDTKGFFGLIDADDGRLVLFNLRGVNSLLRDRFKVGTRVEFVEQSGSPMPRAAALVPVVTQ